MARTAAPAEGEGEPLVDEELDLGGEVEEEPIETGEEVEIEPEEPGEGEEPAEEPEEPAELPRRGGGGARTPRDLRRRAQEAERQLAEERRQREEDRARLRALEQRVSVDPAAQARAAEEERQRVAALPFEEQTRYYYEKGRQESQTLVATIQFQNADALDAQRYEASCMRSPARERLRSQVDALLASERAQGRNHTRDAIFKHLYGEERERLELDARTKTVPRQRAAAAARVAAQQTRPGGTRSDGGAGRRPAADSVEAARARIAGRPLW